MTLAKEQYKELLMEQIARYIHTLEAQSNPLASPSKYILKSEGKRVRPLLLLTTCHAFRQCDDLSDVAVFALAIELIHTYSLIHDDLPAMDDDDYRRGKLAVHRAFSEDYAILTGDALLSDAFSEMCSASLSSKNPVNGLKAMHYIAESVGSRGMILGQCLDIEGDYSGIVAYDQMVERKTCDLFMAAMVSGAILGGAGDEETHQIERIARYTGFIFQYLDDLDDLSQDMEAEKKNVALLLDKKSLEQRINHFKQQLNHELGLLKQNAGVSMSKMEALIHQILRIA